jgi:glycosyltransferase involved in cell wall biosynthesis
MAKRIYMNIFDDWGCGYYRCKLPALQCYSDLGKERINLYSHKELHSEDDAFYDAYVVHRIPAESCIFFGQKAQRAGKKFVIELDDDIFSIPDWMPSEEFKNPKWSLKRALDMSDEIWVSTDSLAEAIDRPDKVHVLPNLVDVNAFMDPPAPSLDNPFRILWMGSMWHERDLEQLVEPVERLIAEYGDKIQFLFWGCLPTAFADYRRVPGQNIALLQQKQTFGSKLLFLEGVSFKCYFDRIMQLRPYIGLAPLFDCKFNDSKSNLKWLEYTMAGAATIATKMPPYKHINNNETGLLVDPLDSEGWYKAIKSLIEDRDLRDSLVKNSKKEVFEHHSWQSQGKKKIWLDAFRRLVK